MFGKTAAVLVQNLPSYKIEFIVNTSFLFSEFKKQLSTDTSPDKGRKSISERPLLGDIIKEATSSGKYYLGR